MEQEMTELGFEITYRWKNEAASVQVTIPEGNPGACRFVMSAPLPNLSADCSYSQAIAYALGESGDDAKGLILLFLHLLMKFCGAKDMRDELVFYLKDAVKIAQCPEAASDFVGWGGHMEQRRDYKNAAICYAEALKLNPTEQYCAYFGHNNLGYSLNQLDRFSEAEPYCRRAIEIWPERYNAHKNLGVSLQGQERLIEAAESFLKAAELVPSETRALGHLRVLLGQHPEIGEQRPDIIEGIRRIYGDVPSILLARN